MQFCTILCSLIGLELVWFEQGLWFEQAWLVEFVLGKLVCSFRLGFCSGYVICYRFEGLQFVNRLGDLSKLGLLSL